MNCYFSAYRLRSSRGSLNFNLSKAQVFKYLMMSTISGKARQHPQPWSRRLTNAHRCYSTLWWTDSQQGTSQPQLILCSCQGAGSIIHMMKFKRSRVAKSRLWSHIFPVQNLEYYCNKDKDVQTFIDQAFKSIAGSSSATPDFHFSNYKNSADTTKFPHWKT